MYGCQDNETLPFSGVDDVNERETFNTGRRTLSPYSSPVSIRNFLAGHVKKSLRMSSSKNHQMYTDIVFRLPIEIGLLVFEHLHPIDLHHMTQVSRYFRRLLLDRKVSGVWKTAFQRHKEIPACPPGTAYPQWTFLLFGPGVCTECGRLGALADFALRQRYCSRCMDKRSQLLPMFMDNRGKPLTKDHCIYSMVSCSYRITSPSYTFFNPSFRRARSDTREVKATIMSLALLEILVGNGLPFLADILDEFKARKVKRAKTIKTYTDRANRWAVRTYREVLKDWENSQRRVIQKCSQRLLNLGYDPRDVDYCGHIISHSVRQSGVYKLTSKAFQKLRPELEEYLLHRMKIRIQAEKKEIIQSLYEDYQMKLNPSIWLCLPPAYMAPHDEGFQDILDKMSDVKDSMSLEGLSSLFDTFVVNWTRFQQSRLLEMIPLTLNEIAYNQESYEGSPDQHQLPIEKLEIASHVFSCRQCSLRNSKGRVLIGWEAIGSHINQPRTSRYRAPCSKCKYSEFLSGLSRTLVDSLGLDPLKTTRKEMDSRGDRFLCARCEPLAFHGSTINLKAYTWIEYVRHQAEMRTMELPTHISPSWKILTSQGAEYVRAHEHQYPLPNWTVWRCNRCSVHFSSPVTRPQAAAHVLKVHFGGRNPDDVQFKEEDIVLDKRFWIGRRKPFTLKINPEHNLKCLRCPERSFLKVWDRTSLERHLRLKHSVDNPMAGVDWTSVDFVAGIFSINT